MSNTLRAVPGHVLSRYEGRSRDKLARGHWPCSVARRDGDGLSRGEAWTPESKRFAKREVARARRRAGREEVGRED